jgi:hypothetical protein
MTKRALLFLAALALALVQFASAQTSSKGTATLSGIVIGPDDKPVPHASVSYQYSDGSGPHAAFADSHGRFTITQLKSSSYDIRASSKGVFSEWQRNIPLRKGQSKSVDLHLIYAREMPTTAKPKQ